VQEHKQRIRQLKEQGTWDWLWREIDHALFFEWKKGEANREDVEALKRLQTRIMVICGDTGNKT
jgi:hypothetical protein